MPSATEELARAEAPEHIGLIGIGMAGPTILAHGTEEQKERFHKILRNIIAERVLGLPKSR